MLHLINRSIVSRTGNLGGHTLLQDTYPLKIMRSERIISEDIHGDQVSVLRIGGQFQLSGRPNANGRIYPEGVLRQAVEEIQKDIKSRSVLGEFDHPPDAKIHLDRVSHLITKLWIDNSGAVFGEAEVLDNTILGKQLYALLERKIRVGISSRGVGDMETAIYENEEYYKVLPGYTFVTFDIVAEPSVHGSYMSVMESKNRLLNRSHSEKVGRDKKIIVEVRNFLEELR